MKEGARTEVVQGQRRAPYGAGVERVLGFATSAAFLWCVLALGGLLRIARYADNRSLWLDESFLALNIIGKSAGDLFGQLDYLQAAPPGFLLVERLAVVLFGEEEWALRLFPLIGAVASLLLFRAVARRFVAGAWLLLATVLFAVNEPLIYYSSEVKPYSTDVAVALGLALLACRLIEKMDDHASRRYLLLGAAGVTAVWFSYPAVFVLAAILVALLVRGLETRARHSARWVAALGLAWLLSFVGVYVVTSKNTSRIADAIFASGETHPGLRRLPVSDNIHQAWGLFVDPFGFEHGTNGLAVLAFLVGVFALARRRNELERLALLTLPLVAAFGAAILDRYPLGGRFSLFLVPFALVVLSHGVQEIGALSRNPLIVAVPIAAFLALPPTSDAISKLLDPPAPEDVRLLLGHLVDNAEGADVLYVYRNAQYALRYYAECDACDAWTGSFPWPLRPVAGTPGSGVGPALESVLPTTLIQQPGALDQALDDLDELDRLPRGKRIWFLFSHVQAPRGLNEEALYLAYLDKNGRRLDGRRTEGAALYLYELNRPKP